MVNDPQRVLSVADYIVFASMLLISTLIGIFYAIRHRNSTDGTASYLMASRLMGPVPVGFSLAVSFQSSILALGVPADVYKFGMIYIWMTVSLVLVGIIVSVVFLPTLYSLQVSSSYEYLEKRFSKKMRLITTGIYLLQNLLYMGVNVYGPALVLSGVTGFSFMPAMLSTALVAILYTTLGGLRGVIWTDVFQGCIMIAGLLAFIIKGSIAVGGFHKVWEIAEEGDRTNILVFDADPRIRYTFWSVVVGVFVSWTGLLGTNQTQVQRLLSVKSINKSRIALFLGVFGVIVFTIMGSFCGIILYSFYQQCDPVTAGCIEINDQMMPYAALDMFRGLDGLPGLFVAVVFSASLSTVSSGINSMVTVTIEDFIKPHTKWSEKKYTWVAKGLGIVFGALTLGVAFLASVLGDIMSVGIGGLSSFAGPSLGIFLLGIWCPFANSVGAVCGFIVGVVLSMTMFLGGRSVRKPNHLLRALEVSTEGCPADCGYMNSVTSIGNKSTSGFTSASTSGFTSASTIGFTSAMSNDSIELTGIENYYAISYFHTASVGLAFTLVFGIACSLLSCGWRQRHKVDPTLMRPPFESRVFKWLPERIRSILRCGIKWDGHVETETEPKVDGDCQERKLPDSGPSIEMKGLDAKN